MMHTEPEKGEGGGVDTDLAARLRNWVNTAFWITYIVVPLLTGVLQYHWLPNESFDERHQIMLESREVEDQNDNPVEVPGVWEDKETGAVYSYEGFRHHRHSEAVRSAFV
jgi:hypothetical protein